eukprot:CAMPEP_0179323356 /NCGR_PEP_ID=MMETSP0797-20121207/59675_1 /TAXON_ID=47934 /ORGANISM="Dinophysis acuminata, Strain DAEP01" /LENGTH=209 /DNA_ID=CAMNT_0021035189 /DNA_START=369 /DNA_END=993 /DNA_ORIENTATION=-
MSLVMGWSSLSSLASRLTSLPGRCPRAKSSGLVLPVGSPAASCTLTSQTVVPAGTGAECLMSMRRLRWTVTLNTLPFSVCLGDAAAAVAACAGGFKLATPMTKMSAFTMSSAASAIMVLPSLSLRRNFILFASLIVKLVQILDDGTEFLHLGLPREVQGVRVLGAALVERQPREGDLQRVRGVLLVLAGLVAWLRRVAAGTVAGAATLA